jgi:L-cystine uptake protein TcyP (sodium:dicarboxylate symporter family)
MLSVQEEKFLDYWEKNRDKEKRLLRQLFIGLPIGLLLGIGIMASLSSGWYERADMVANSQLNPNVLTIAIVAIAVFIGIFYKKYRWDMNEQHYRELLARKQAEEKAQAADSGNR